MSDTPKPPDPSSDPKPPPTPSSSSPPPQPPPPAAPPRWNEVGYANRLEQLIGAGKCVGSRWFIYRVGEGVWRESSCDLYRPKALSILPPLLRTERHAATLLRHLEAKWQDDINVFRGAIHTTGCKKGVLLNCLNGVLRVTPTDITLLPHSPTYYFTRTLRVAYDPLAEAREWDRVFKVTLPDPADQDLFLYFMAYCLVPHCRFHASLVCFGETGTGKSTLSDPITAIFGDDEEGLMTHLSMAQICDPKSYSLPKLRWACVNLGTELQSIEVEESANFKLLAAGESVEARTIYDKPFRMRPHCKFWFLANCLPRFRAGTGAELRRLRFLHFQNKPEQIDGMLPEKLKLEHPGIFNLIVKHLQQLLTMNEMPRGSAPTQAIYDRFDVSNDPVGSFVARHCVLDPASDVPKIDLKTNFQRYCQVHGISEKVNDRFFRVLYERYPKVTASRLRKDGDLTQMVKGIRLQPDSPIQMYGPVESSFADFDIPPPPPADTPSQ